MQAARGTSLNERDSTEENTVSPGRRGPALLLFWTSALVALAIDQVTKAWAERRLQGEGYVEVFGDWFGLHLTHNPGAAFSLGTAFTEVLSIFAIVATVVVVVLSFRVRARVWGLGLGLLLAGVCGNLADRLFREPAPLHGHVVDFLALPNWPIFNVADICINLAAAVIIVQAVRGIRLDGTRHD